ncbi:MAG: hypothetical protein RQ754_14470 [Desulfuromonadales bacterium]|nr:hypothetical protein [Desulfuromonadales bacterium]
MQNNDKIKVVTESGQSLEVLVTSFSAEAIWVLIGEGPHSSKCKLEPTRNGLAYAGSIMGREIIYQRSVKDLREELARKGQGGSSHRWKR